MRRARRLRRPETSLCAPRNRAHYSQRGIPRSPSSRRATADAEGASLATPGNVWAFIEESSPTIRREEHGVRNLRGERPLRRRVRPAAAGRPETSGHYRGIEPTIRREEHGVRNLRGERPLMRRARRLRRPETSPCAPRNRAHYSQRGTPRSPSSRRATPDAEGASSSCRTPGNVSLRAEESSPLSFIRTRRR
jgi:hypothetical protein